MDIVGINGSALSPKSITEEVNVTLKCQSIDSTHHVESDCVLSIIRSPDFPVILGLPWLKMHQPAIDWHNKTLNFNSDTCKSHHDTPIKETFEDDWNVDLDDEIPPMEVKMTSLPSHLMDFSDVFDPKKAEELPPHRAYDCEIILLPDKTPPVGPIYPLSVDEDKLLEEYIKDNLRKGFIRESTSSVAAPIFFIDKGKNVKREGKVPEKRLVVNYRGLDKCTAKFRYPMPLITSLLDKLRTAKIFTKIDLRSAYNLIRIKEGDEWKTAFRTKYGLYEYRVMPFGLANAPAYFQQFVNNTFQDMIDRFVVIYLDDFLIFSPDEASHQEHVRAVLQRLRDNKLYAKLEKCQFGLPTVKFLGYWISANGIACDDEKVRSIMEWPVPRSKHQVMVFLGLTNYLRKFVDGFAEMALPLYKLCKKDTQFNWRPECQEAFEALKKAISTVPVLKHVDPEEPMQVETDASNFAVGSVLSQEDTEGQQRPCAYYSRSLTAPERNYTTYDKELLAIKEAFDEWRHYLEGSKHPITVYSDHKGLESLADAKVLNQRQARWSLFFNRFNFKIKYRPGKENCQADALSRRPDYQPLNEVEKEKTILEPNVVQIAAILTRQMSFLDRLKEVLPQDEFYLSQLSSNGENPFIMTNGIPYFQGRIYVPEGQLRLEVLTSCHDSKLAGHFGKNKTLELATRKYYWPNMDKMIHEYCASCETCARAKPARHAPYGLLMPLSVPEGPWTSIGMDFITDLPPSEGMTVVLTVVDRFTKMVHFIPLQKLPNAEETAWIFLKEIVRLHGLPKEIVSDRGSQFISRLMETFIGIIGNRIMPLNCISSRIKWTSGKSKSSFNSIPSLFRFLPTE